MNNFHILTLKKSGHDDEDFIKYTWDPKKYNKLQEGNYVIFHRSKRGSEFSEFYFFGSAMIESVFEKNGFKIAKFCNVNIFKNFLMQKELIKIEENLKTFSWSFKKRNFKKGYEHFFNQYGITEIDKKDFLGILKAANSIENFERLDFSGVNLPASKKTIKEITERIGHATWAEFVKKASNYECVLTGIKEKKIIEAAHLASHSEFKKYGRDKSNGIALLNLFHDLYDLKIMKIDDEWKVHFDKKRMDHKLWNFVSQYENKKINIGNNNPQYFYININGNSFKNKF